MIGASEKLVLFSIFLYILLCVNRHSVVVWVFLLATQLTTVSLDMFRNIYTELFPKNLITIIILHKHVVDIHTKYYATKVSQNKINDMLYIFVFDRLYTYSYLCVKYYLLGNVKIGNLKKKNKDHKKVPKQDEDAGNL